MDGTLTIDPKPQAQRQKSSRLMMFVNDRDSYDAARELVDTLSLPPSVVQAGDITVARSFIAPDNPPDVAIIDLGDADEPIRMMRDLTEHIHAPCSIVAIGRMNDVRFFRALQDAGVCEYLVKPVDADQLRDAIAAGYHALKAKRQPEPGTPAEAVARGKVSVLVGSRGGVGTSTIAVNTAWILAHEMKHKVALLDLDLHFGVAPLSLDINPSTNLREVLADPQRMDDLLIASVLVNESDNLSVLGSEEPLDSPIAQDSEALSALLGELRDQFDNVIVDLPRSLVPVNRELLRDADEVVVTADFSIPALRDMTRLRSYLEEIEKTKPIILAGCRISKSRQPQVPQAYFEKGLKHKLDLIVPDDDRQVAEAANNGRPLAAVAPKSPATAAIRVLAEKIAGSAEEEKAAKSGSVVKKLLAKVKAA